MTRDPASSSPPGTATPGATLRDAAIGTLSAWYAPDLRQDRLRREYLDHLGSRQDGMWRSCGAGHLTAGAAVLDHTGRRVLLTLHGTEHIWLQLGGHCEAGDASLRAVAAREAAEESGIAGLTLLPGPLLLDRHTVRRCGTNTAGTVHLDVQYAAVAPAGATERISDESLDLRWFDVTALPEGTDASVRALVAAAVRAHPARPHPVDGTSTRT